MLITNTVSCIQQAKATKHMSPVLMSYCDVLSAENTAVTQSSVYLTPSVIFQPLVFQFVQNRPWNVCTNQRLSPEACSRNSLLWSDYKTVYDSIIINLYTPNIHYIATILSSGKSAGEAEPQWWLNSQTLLLCDDKGVLWSKQSCV